MADVLVATPTFEKAVMDLLIAHALAGPTNGPLDLLKLTLSTNPLPEGVDLDFTTDVAEPGYAGYAAQTVTWSPTYRRADGRLGTTGGLLTFAEGGAITPVSVVAACLYLSGAPNKVMLVINFSTPMTLVDALSAIKLVCEVALAGDDWGKIESVAA